MFESSPIPVDSMVAGKNPLCFEPGMKSLMRRLRREPYEERREQYLLYETSKLNPEGRTTVLLWHMRWRVWDSCNKKEESAADESARKSVLNFIPVVERPGKTSKKSLSEENTYL